MKCKHADCKRTARINWAFCEFHIQTWLDGQHR